MTEKKPKHVNRFVVIGVCLTVFNFLLYTAIARWVFNNNDLLWLSTLISTLATTILAYILHSRITWKERSPGKYGVYMFFVWNLTAALIVGPFLTWLFGLMTPVYEFAFNISQALHLPFDYSFVQSTGIFGFASVISMILNYLFYDRLVFGTKKEEEKEEE